MNLYYGFIIFIQLRLSCGEKYAVPDGDLEKDSDYWHALGEEELIKSLRRSYHTTLAKNVIIFVGDGMGIAVTTAARIYKGQKKGTSGEEGKLVWDDFPNIALMKTYNVDKQVPDSSSTATAFFTGVKTNTGTVGVTGRVQRKNCSASREEANVLKSILGWFQEEGKDTGIVTTTRLTHATPAALYAHSADRDWECDSSLKKQKDTEKCKDIARQLVEDLPGRGVNVLLGGGRYVMGANITGDQQEDSCLRNDSMNLVEEWRKEKISRDHSAEYVTSTEQLRNLNVEDTDFILGLFGGNHVPYEFMRDKTLDGIPSLKEMTQVAIRRLKRSEKGFFLMVEGGRVDIALHATRPRVALEEALSLEEAVEAAVKMTDEEDTLIIVTADHSHVMTINGYPDRGNDILGVNMDNTTMSDGLPYTTLMFTNGFGANFTYTGGKVQRTNLTGVDTRDHYFHPQAAAPTNEQGETHAGEDIATYASGPFAHLFHHVHEQSFIARVMGYAACVGPYRNNCPHSSEPTWRRKWSQLGMRLKASIS